MAVIVAVFQLIFSAGKPLMDLVQPAIDTSGNWIGAFIPNATLRSLVVQGIWNGVEATLVGFLPRRFCCCLYLSGFLRTPVTWRAQR